DEHVAPQPDVERLYAAYAERLRRYLFLKTGEAELSADLVQDCFARLLAHQEDVPLDDTALAYLYAIANRLLIDHRRNHHQSRTDMA
ncbi:sigma-70 family RNA polymerase sigma factor, partial [Salmonella enterica]|nr:sigma-70 family RNA polymerase sigma factor [Salmonella enterica]